MRHLNPLYLLDKKICPELVLAVRLLAIYLLVTREGAFMGNQGGGRFLPVFGILNQFGSDEIYNLAVRLIGWAGMALLICSSFVRTGAFLTGISIVVGTISCQTCISVAHLFTACVFICTSLSNLDTGSQLIRYQLIVLYVGANLNKLIDPDWWNGAAIETLLVAKHQIPLYIQLSDLFPSMLLSTMLGISVMILQFAIPMLLLGKTTFRYACLAAILLHIPMVILMQMTFGPFVMALAIAYSSLLHWPRHLLFHADLHSPLIVSILAYLDFNGQIRHLRRQDFSPEPAAWPRTIFDFMTHPLILLAIMFVSALLVRYGKTIPLSLILLVIFFSKVWPQTQPEEQVAGEVSV